MMMLERDGSLRVDARTRMHGRSVLLQHLARRTRSFIKWHLGWTRSGVGRA